VDEPCPHCGSRSPAFEALSEAVLEMASEQRSLDRDGKQGLLNQAVACERCGFGFLFELLDDYYPSPNAGLIACDRTGRILAAGRGFSALAPFVVGFVAMKYSFFAAFLILAFAFLLAAALALLLPETKGKELE